MSDRFVVSLPVHVNQRERAVLDQRFRVVGRLRNAALGSLLAAGEQARRDPAWTAARRLPKGAERTRAFQELRRRYGLTEYGATEVARRHWQASRWMGDLIDQRTAHQVAKDLFVHVDRWLVGQAGKPRFRRTDSIETVWGESDQGGLVLRGGKVRWNTRRGAAGKLARKSLLLDVDWSAISRPRREHLAGLRVVRIGLQRKTVRGRERWFVLVCYAGAPYRNPEYLKTVNRKGKVGLDLGPSTLAIVGESSSELVQLISRDQIQKERERAAFIRRQQRALDRSRRATNPDAFDEQGRYRPGQRITTRSNRYVQRQRRLTEASRVQAVHRKHEAVRVARRVALHGTVAATEKASVRGWKESGLKLGKRMNLTAPGQVQQRVERELELLGGKLNYLPTQRLALSQHCLCGARVRKRLSERTHKCECGLGPLDRDLFSALLARLVLQTGVVDLGDAPFRGLTGIQAETERLCPVPCHARGITGTTRSQGGRTGSRANPRRDPGDKSVPTRKSGTKRPVKTTSHSTECTIRTVK